MLFPTPWTGANSSEWFITVLLNLFDVAAHIRTYQQVAQRNEATEAWKALGRVLTYVTRGHRTCLGFVEPTIAIQGWKWEHALDGMRQ